jgi:hypothetical protein
MIQPLCRQTLWKPTRNLTERLMACLRIREVKTILLGLRSIR